ncbi:hypothetical protein [Amycolatopsis sp. WAC 01376]|uniref:hypothetical protein n=1 Tax=Amycolatopsis sp. WAC 01376 TaxID=2203195 RepID=UPI001F17C041|nr:hypothetical protein [Amycolatopsis sp. WAC 01376]
MVLPITLGRVFDLLWALGLLTREKDQVRVLEELREKLPSLDTPEPSSIKRDRPRRVRQLRADQVEQLIAGYRSGETVYGLGDWFGIERRTLPRPFISLP